MFIMFKFAENVDNVDHFEGVHNVDNNYKIENIDNVNNDDSVMWLCVDNVVDIRQHLKNMTQLLRLRGLILRGLNGWILLRLLRLLEHLRC